MAYEGRLELTWTNKHLRLLAHDDGSYEWVSPADYRVAEVRLLHDAAVVGDVGAKRAADNLLIRGDALNALTSLARLPEFAEQYLGKVKLAYLDPPFNTQQSFLQYDDALEHSVWLTMMRDRLVQIRDLLAPNGSVWVHLDDSEMAYCEVMMDEVFGRQNAIAVAVWEKTYTPKSNGRGLSTDHDYILCYAKDASEWYADGWNFLPRSVEQEARFKNPDDDPRGPWRTYPLDVRTENEDRRAGYRYPVVLPSGREVLPAKGRHWALPKQRFEDEREKGLIWFGADGNAMPTKKVYLSEAREGVIARTWWTHGEVGSSQDAKRECKALFPELEPFATPKPERLLHRILQIASNPGDIVLDCFVGSGTTAAVAHKMGRRWVAIEREQATIETFAIPRLAKVVRDEDEGGVTSVSLPSGEGLPEGVKAGEGRAAARTLKAMADAGFLNDVEGLDKQAVAGLIKALRSIDKMSTTKVWSGGGGFRVLSVAPSMFEADDGIVFLAEGMTNGQLAEATAAQLGFAYDVDPPFAGRKGRSRLAVVDGIVNEAVVRLLVNTLPENERVVVCGTAIDTDVRPLLRELRPGSTLRKIPAALLDEFRLSRQLRLSLDEAADELPAEEVATT